MEKESEEEFEIEETLFKSLGQERGLTSHEFTPPEELSIIPVVKRPFFPGMAAPIVIEPGPYYELLKKIAKSDHKCLGFTPYKKGGV